MQLWRQITARQSGRNSTRRSVADRESPFATVYQRLLLSGWLTEKSGSTIVGFFSRVPGEGVTTVANGLAHEFSGRSDGRSLCIQIQTAHPSKGAPGTLASQCASRDAKVAFGPVTATENPAVDRLTLSRTAIDAEREHACVTENLSVLRQRYRLITVDVGAFGDGACRSWRPHLDKLALVIDASSSRREALGHFRKELERSGLRVDGLIVNQRRYPVPDFLYDLLS